MSFATDRQRSRRRRWSWAALAAVGALVHIGTGCSGGHSHDDAGGHAHGAPADSEGELPGQAVTVWTERTELFMEYRPLIVGAEVRFAAHVTEMPSFQPVTFGTVELRIQMADGATVAGTADAPSSPGIFRPTVRLDRAGDCELSMAIRSPQLHDTVPIGPCRVFADEDAARAALGHAHETPGAITFLKEQQWKTEFATIEATVETLQPSVRATGQITPVAGQEVILAASIRGVLRLSAPTPTVGREVKAGEVLATIAPLLAAQGDLATIEADVAASRAEAEAAAAELARVERLAAQQSIATRRVEEARARATTADARAAASSQRREQYLAGAGGSKSGAGGQRRTGDFQVRSPITGVLVDADATSGAVVEQGQALFRVIRMDRVWIAARVFESDLPRIEGAESCWFLIEGRESPYVVEAPSGRLVDIGRVIDPLSRTVPVRFELDNPEGQLRIGQFAEVHIPAGPPVRQVALPPSAILQEGAGAVAYVMAGGEEFERRSLGIGVRTADWVGITAGIAPGERVVTTGAYEIKLQAASGVIPAHGHAH